MITPARRSYNKRRAASRAADVARLQARAGPAPLTVAEAASPSPSYVVTGPGGSCVGRYQVVAVYIDGFVAAWEFAGRPRSLADRPGLQERQEGQTEHGVPERDFVTRGEDREDHGGDDKDDRGEE